MTPHNRM